MKRRNCRVDPCVPFICRGLLKILSSAAMISNPGSRWNSSKRRKSENVNSCEFRINKISVFLTESPTLYSPIFLHPLHRVHRSISASFYFPGHYLFSLYVRPLISFENHPVSQSCLMACRSVLPVYRPFWKHNDWEKKAPYLRDKHL